MIYLYNPWKNLTSYFHVKQMHVFSATVNLHRQAVIPRHDFHIVCWWKEVPKKEETNHKEEEEDEPLVKDTAVQNS